MDGLTPDQAIAALTGGQQPQVPMPRPRPPGAGPDAQTQMLLQQLMGDTVPRPPLVGTDDYTGGPYDRRMPGSTTPPALAIPPDIVPELREGPGAYVPWNVLDPKIIDINKANRPYWQEAI